MTHSDWSNLLTHTAWKKGKTIEGQASEFDLIELYFFYGDIRDSRKYDTFRGKQAVLFIIYSGKG